MVKTICLCCCATSSSRLKSWAKLKPKPTVLTVGIQAKIPMPLSLYQSIRLTILEAKQKVVVTVNVAMLETYWQIGRYIVEEEQQGKHKAEYGKQQMQELAKKLTEEFGSGFDRSNLLRMKNFYILFPIRDTLRHELSWSHYRTLLSIENPKAREFYIQEAIANEWSTRALDRQVKSLYHERLLSSQNRNEVKAEMQEKTKELQPEEILKDPYILEFLQLKDRKTYLESELEQALMDKLNEFLLELGKGFAFVGRQKRISTETKHFYIDLVFYNYILKCFVLIDLKVGELTHQDIGQMDMYVRLYEDKYKNQDDNPTIGLILCTHKDQTVVKYSVLSESTQLFASKYVLYLPTETELIAELEREKLLIENESKKLKP
jgi:predicted nuclease of restriction endonuclease-like (RecB) superfamily